MILTQYLLTKLFIYLQFNFTAHIFGTLDQLRDSNGVQCTTYVINLYIGYAGLVGQVNSLSIYT